MKKIFLLFISFLLINTIFFWGLWDTYFQQDEWFLFGRAINQLNGLPFSVFQFASKHFWPLGSIFWIFLYKIFGLQSFYYAIVAIILQSFAAVTVYYFFKVLLRRSDISFLGAVLFSVSFPSMQPVVWFVIPPFLIPCLIFILLFLIYLDNSIRRKKITKKEITILSILFIISYFFREEAVILLPLAPLYIFLFKKIGRRETLKKISILLAIMILLIFIRIILERFFGDNVTFEKTNIIISTLYNTLTIPPKMIIQSVIDLSTLWDLSRLYTRFAFPRLMGDGLTIEQTIFEHIVIIFMIPLTFLTGLSFSKMKQHDKKIFAFSLAWILLCSFIISPQSRRLPFLESRYLYVGSLGVFLFIYSIFSGFKTNLSKRMMRLLIGALSLSFIIYSYFNIQGYIVNIYIPRSENRIEILKQVKNIQPVIPRQVVIYIECKEQNDCIPNGLVLPFQSGVGQMLLVIYAQQNEKAYAPFFEDFYLWDWEAQDYMEIGGYGFGYYREREKLYEDAKKGKFLPEDVIGFSYDTSENKIEDITGTIRNAVKNSVKFQKDETTNF